LISGQIAKIVKIQERKGPGPSLWKNKNRWPELWFCCTNPAFCEVNQENGSLLHYFNSTASAGAGNFLLT
jgi:hypothetical protein